MQLLDRTGFRADGYVRADAAAAKDAPAAIVPYAELAGASSTGKLGVDISNSVNTEEIAPHFGKLALIAIAFPSSGDGRGFSLARRLRRAGFTGVVRAVGPLISDQFPYALACGFDEIELTDDSAARQPPEQWARALTAITTGYQEGDARAGSIMEQRKRAREEGRNA